jgi:hypothetical protein
MSEQLNELIHALREELQQYGEMLARLDEQHEKVMQRAADDLLQTVARVQSQGAVIERARRAREAAQRVVARQLLLPERAGFVQIIPILPEQYRPLMDALIQENCELLQRVQERARQNHLLLSRSLNLMQRFMSSLFPANGESAVGRRSVRLEPARPLYDAAR